MNGELDFGADQDHSLEPEIFPEFFITALRMNT